MNNQEKITKIKNDNQYVKLFVKDTSFITATENAVLVRINDIYFWVASKMCNVQAKSKEGKVYNSITINRNWTYKTWKNKKENDTYIKYDEKEIKGQQIINYFFN